MITLKSYRSEYGSQFFYNWFESLKYPMFFRSLCGHYTQESFAQLPQLMGCSFYLAVDGDKVIGALAVHGWNVTARNCSVGILIDEQHQDQGLCGELIKAIGFYLIKHKGMHKLSFCFSKEDKKILHLVEREKFIKEGEFKDGAFINGRYVDTVEYAFFAERLAEYE